ncbi:hypothetical protein FJ250_06915 [bacterium]|nr:hypothetical protein [bacterium]
MNRLWRRPGSGAQRRSVGVAVALAVVWTATDSAMALPRYTAQYGQDCRLCHVNPTGGGLRNDYARRDLVPLELASRGAPAADDAPTGALALPAGMAVGADLRTLAWLEEGGAGSVFSMQGDVYLALEAAGNVTLYAEQGQHGGGEVFGIAHGVIPRGWVKAGRFVPDYGWRFDDHRLFARRHLFSAEGADSPAGLLGSGVEAGATVGGLGVTVSALEGQARLGDSYAARALWRRELGSVRAGAGASVWHRGGERAAGAFWYLAGGPVAWLGEVDETRGDGSLARLVTNELTCEVRRGLAARVVYCFQDPDLALLDGARHRLGAGVSWLATPALGVQVMANRWRIDEGAAVDDVDRCDGELMFHFMY